MNDTSASHRLAEVIEAGSSVFRAQCYRLYEAPALGSLVAAGAPAVYGVVCRVSTEPLDPSRPVLARGESAQTEEQVYLDNPQIARLLTSRFEALIVGHQLETGISHHLPPLPPRVHSFVKECSPDEITDFSSGLGFIHLLVSAGPAASEEVIRACMLRLIEAHSIVAHSILAHSIDAHSGPPEFRVQVGKALAKELAGDVPQLTAILRGLAQ
jgi:hypothetical protein